MTNNTWPDAYDAVNEFYKDDLQPVLDLWKHFGVPRQGPGRPPGPRRTQWLSTLVVAYAALEAGLENIVLAAHGHRNLRTRPILSRNRRKYLVEQPLMSPNTDRIERLLFSQFGIELKELPDVAKFTARVKLSARATTSRGAKRSGPSDWNSLSQLLRAISYARNVIAHGDTRHGQLPTGGEGYIWVRQVDGTWSVQKAHALTGVRTIISVYNTVADALNESTGFFMDSSPLLPPNSLIDYDQ